MINPGLNGKVALVTGANHGIGEAIVQALADQGGRVLAAYWNPTSPYSADELEKALKSGQTGDVLYRAYQQRAGEDVELAVNRHGGVATPVRADLTDPESVPFLFDHCESKLGPVDILINNHAHCVLATFDPAAATGIPGPSLLSALEADRHFAINARSVALMMAEYLRRYLGRQATCGRIINISTDAADDHPGNISYAASKHALESYSRSAAAEMGQYGITVNVVAPGPIQTGDITAEQESWVVARTRLGRVGQSRDIADVVVFLASEQARWVSAQLLYVGGGYKMPL